LDFSFENVPSGNPAHAADPQTASRHFNTTDHLKRNTVGRKWTSYKKVFLPK
jgi:hypothetical protein